MINTNESKRSIIYNNCKWMAMNMTVMKLYKELGRLIADGAGSKTVSINKTTFSHSLELDGCTILPVKSVDLVWVPTIADDGGTKENKDGSESGRVKCVLYGNDERGRC